MFFQTSGFSCWNIPAFHWLIMCWTSIFWYIANYILNLSIANGEFFLNQIHQYNKNCLQRPYTSDKCLPLCSRYQVLSLQSTAVLPLVWTEGKQKCCRVYSYVSNYISGHQGLCLLTVKNMDVGRNWDKILFLILLVVAAPRNEKDKKGEKEEKIK